MILQKCMRSTRRTSKKVSPWKQIYSWRKSSWLYNKITVIIVINHISNISEVIDCSMNRYPRATHNFQGICSLEHCCWLMWFQLHICAWNCLQQFWYDSDNDVWGLLVINLFWACVNLIKNYQVNAHGFWFFILISWIFSKKSF